MVCYVVFLFRILLVSPDCWYLFALLIRHVFAGLLRDCLAHRDFLLCTFLLWNLGTHVFGYIVAHFLWHILTFGWVVPVRRLADFLIDCFAFVFQLFFADICVDSLTLVSVFVMTVENFFSIAHLFVNCFANFLQFITTCFQGKLSTLIATQQIINTISQT